MTLNLLENTPKNLLCTVSEDPNMFNGLRFLSRFFKNKSSLRLTLFCMASQDSTYCQWRAGNLKLDGGVANPMALDQNWDHAHEEALRTLKWEGFPEDNIRSKCSLTMACRIEDILDELEEEDYNAVVMGRRGLSRLKDFADKPLSKKLLEQKHETPMWLCRKPDFNRKNVLLCADGSDSSYRMAAHVADMLKDEDHMVTLCRIVKIKSEGNREESYDIFSRCEEIMAGRGLDSSRLRQMIYPSDHVARAILDNANWGRFAVVAMGRSSGGLKHLFGSITGRVFTELSGSVLWVHP